MIKRGRLGVPPTLRGEEGGQGRRGVSLQAAGRPESFGDAGLPPSYIFFFFLTLHFLCFFQDCRAQLVIAVTNGTKTARVCVSELKEKQRRDWFCPGSGRTLGDYSFFVFFRLQCLCGKL